MKTPFGRKTEREKKKEKSAKRRDTHDGERRRCTTSTSTSRSISRGDGGCDAVGCPHGWCCYSERYVRNTHARCLASKEARDLVRPQPCALGCNSMQLRCLDRILVLQEGKVGQEERKKRKRKKKKEKTHTNWGKSQHTTHLVSSSGSQPQTTHKLN